METIADRGTTRLPSSTPKPAAAFTTPRSLDSPQVQAQFKMLHADMRPPFRPANFVEGIRAAEAAGAEVVIVDSFSHEYDGEGGIMDWADELETAGTRSPGNWKVPKRAHKKMMNTLLQCRASLIFCLRADEKIEIIKEGGKTLVRPLGWMPICEKRFMYEMTASFTLTPERPGQPRFDLPHKLQQQHRGMFQEGEPIGEASGQALAAWARGGAPAGIAPDQADGTVPPNLAKAVRAKAQEGSFALRERARSAPGRATRRAATDHGRARPVRG